MTRRKFERIIYDVSDGWMGFLIFDLRPGRISLNEEHKFFRQMRVVRRKTKSGEMTNETFFWCKVSSELNPSHVKTNHVYTKAREKKSLVIKHTRMRKLTNIHLSRFHSPTPTHCLKISQPPTVTYSESVQIINEKPTKNYRTNKEARRSDQKNPKNIYFQILNRSFFLLNDFALLRLPSSPSMKLAQKTPLRGKLYVWTVNIKDHFHIVQSCRELMLINSQVLPEPFKKPVKRWKENGDEKSLVAFIKSMTRWKTHSPFENWLHAAKEKRLNVSFSFKTEKYEKFFSFFVFSKKGKWKIFISRFIMILCWRVVEMMKEHVKVEVATVKKEKSFTHNTHSKESPLISIHFRKSS